MSRMPYLSPTCRSGSLISANVMNWNSSDVALNHIRNRNQLSSPLSSKNLTTPSKRPVHHYSAFDRHSPSLAPRFNHGSYNTTLYSSSSLLSWKNMQTTYRRFSTSIPTHLEDNDDLSHQDALVRIASTAGTAWSILLRKGLDGNLRSVSSSTSLRVVSELFFEYRTGCLIVVEDDNPTAVVGLICERDVLLAYDAYSLSPKPPVNPTIPAPPLHDGTARSGGFIPVRRRGREWPALPAGEVWDTACAKDAMTPSPRVVFGNVGDSCSLLLSIMTRAGFRHLPIIDRQTVDETSVTDGISRSRRVEKSYLVGLLTIHDLVEGLLFSSHQDSMGMSGSGENDGTSSDAKARFISDVMPRRGFPPRTMVYSAPESSKNISLYLETSVYSQPHPAKKDTGGEDAYFSATYLPLEENCYNERLPYSVVGVADGVSSWKYESGVDAGLFSRRLISASAELVSSRIENSNKYFKAKASMQHLLSGIENGSEPVSTLGASVVGSSENNNENDDSTKTKETQTLDKDEVEAALADLAVPLPFPSPLEMMETAWHTVKSEKVVGSATLCIGVLSASATGVNSVSQMKTKRSLSEQTSSSTTSSTSASTVSHSTNPEHDSTSSLSSASVVDEKSEPTSKDTILPPDHLGHTFDAVNVGDAGFLVLRPVRRAARESKQLAEMFVGGSGSSKPSLSDSVDDSQGQSLAPKYRIVYKTLPMLVDFDCPAQLGVDATADGHERFHSPADAVILSVPVKEDDVIIMATDGMFDNLYEKDILEAVNAAEADCFTVSSGMMNALPEVIAQNIGTLAFERSLNKDLDSPFATIAKDNLMMWSGGRKDDITIAVSRVKRGTPAASQGVFSVSHDSDLQETSYSTSFSDVEQNPEHFVDAENSETVNSPTHTETAPPKSGHYISPEVYKIPGFSPQ